MTKLREESNIPLYQQLKEILLQGIDNMEYSTLKLPSETELCEQYQVSRITVRQALSELQREGYVYRKQGRGTFIIPRKIEQNLASLFSFSDEMEKRNLRAYSRVLELSLIVPDAEIAEKLALKAGGQAYYLKRLRYVEQTPVMMEYTYLPAQLFPGFERKNLTDGRLYRIMREDYGVDPKMADTYLGAALMTEEEKASFGDAKTQAVLHVERVTYALNGTVIEYTLASASSDIYRYHIHVGEI